MALCDWRGVWVYVSRMSLVSFQRSCVWVQSPFLRADCRAGRVGIFAAQRTWVVDTHQCTSPLSLPGPSTAELHRAPCTCWSLWAYSDDRGPHSAACALSIHPPLLECVRCSSPCRPAVCPGTTWLLQCSLEMSTESGARREMREESS